jgi:hypothetical protein
MAAHPGMPRLKFGSSPGNLYVMAIPWKGVACQELTRTGYSGAWNPGKGSTIQAQPQPAWPASQRRSARRPDTAEDCHGPRTSTYGQDWSSFPVRKASPRPPAAPQCLQLTARRTHRYRQEQRHGGADADQSAASTYTVSQLSHRLDGQHRTRADGPDTRRILTCGYGSDTLTGRLALIYGSVAPGACQIRARTADVEGSQRSLTATVGPSPAAPEQVSERAKRP